VDSSQQNSDGKVQLSLQAFDANTNALLATVNLDTLANNRRGARSKNIAFNVSQFAGRQIRITLTPHVLSGTNLKWAATVIHEDTTGNGNGVFNMEEFIEAELPREYVVHANYPNPFNPSTQINFDLPEPAQVSLIVFDILGRKVSELASGMFEAGFHSKIWNASGVATGVYFARFTATDANGNMKLSKVNKLLLAK
jgi:hypothetical protein